MAILYRKQIGSGSGIHMRSTVASRERTSRLAQRVGGSKATCTSTDAGFHRMRHRASTWLTWFSKEAIIDFHLKNPLEGYRRLTFMMLTLLLSVPRAFGGGCGKPDCCPVGKPSHRAKEQDSSSRSSRIGIGISMSRISTSAGPSITCAAFWMVTVVRSRTGTCESR